MKKNELSSMTVAELKALARKKKIALPSGAKKADIIKVLAKAVSEGKRTAKRTTGGKAAAKPEAKVVRKSKTSAGGRKAPAGKATPKERSAARKAPAEKAAVQAAPGRDRQMPAAGQEPLTVQERVSDAKYFTGTPDHAQARPYGSLPREYGEERMVLMARDPSTAYGYWELSQSRLDREKKLFGDSRLCVRIYDVTGVQGDRTKAMAYFDQEVYERVGSWYFDLARPAHSFCADLGLRAPDGRFLTLLRSPVVSLPREGVSDVLDEEWSLLDEALYGAPGQPGGRSSLQVREALRQRRMGEISSPGLSMKQKTKK